MNTPRLLIALASGLLASCGGNSSRPDPPDPPLQVIGNSITLHLPAPSIGWYGDWGMAASSQDKDFAHVAAASLGLSVDAYNIAELEFAGDASRIPAVTANVTPYSAVVIELGDDTTSAQAPVFQILYGELLDSTAKASQLVCLSTYWGNTVVDAVIEQECMAHRGVYVYIGDIYPTRQDDVGRYSDPAVDKHPHDWSMAVIASRVSTALTH